MPRPIIRFRLLTITMLMAFLLLGVKVGDVFRGGILISEALVNQAIAQQEAKTPEKTEDKKTEKEKSESADASKDKTDSVAPADAMKEPAGEAAKDAAKDASKDAKPEDVALPGEKTSDDTKKDSIQKEFSAEDISILQSLSKRRDEIEGWAKQVELKENMLGATEQRINDKIVQLKNLQKQLDSVLALYNQHEDAKIRSLVKIYENMKPADAARIFDELELPIMLEVVDKMSERKAAPILANMNPLKAKDLTVELADQRKLQQPMIDEISASQAATSSDTSPAPVADSKDAAPVTTPTPATPSPSAP